MKPTFLPALTVSLVIATTATSSPPPDLDRPQYICLNNNQQFDPGNPASFTQQAVDDVLLAMGNITGSADGTRRLCLGVDMWTQYDSSDQSVLAASTDAFLNLSLTNNIPISLSIDATQWWTTRPELWNWWNSSQEGYNPDNIMNVEWTGPDPTTAATSISWRNWGSQFRMPSPAPNFASPAYKQACAASMLPVAARVGSWYKSLPENKKWLLAYVRVEQELWIGTNYFVYPGANAANGTVMWPPAQDPQVGPAGSAQIGYAALCQGYVNPPSSLQQQTPEQKQSQPQQPQLCTAIPTVASLDGVVSSFISFAADVVASAGIPRSRIMSHTGFFNPPSPNASLVFNSIEASVTNAAHPGWSMYTGLALDPNTAVGLGSLLSSTLQGAPWGAPEWLPFFSGGTEAEWIASINNTFNFHNNRLIVVQNFGSISPSNPAALKAIAQSLQTPPSCLVGVATNLVATQLNSTALLLNWVAAENAGGDNSQTQTLEFSLSSMLLPSGRFAAPFVSVPNISASLDMITMNEIPPGSSVIYWTVSTFGCGAPSTQLMVADVQSIQLQQQ